MNVLDKAMIAFVESDGDRSIMSVNHWATTFHSTGEEVRAAWERAMTAHSLKQHNNCEEFDK